MVDFHRPLLAEWALLNRLQFSAGWGNEDKQNTAPLNKPLYDTNTALFTSFTLSMHIFAISHWLSQHRDVAGECRRDAWVIKWDT